MTSGVDIEEVVANYLRHAKPSARTVVIEDALQLYIAKLDKETQDRILPGFVRRRKARGEPPNPKRRRKDITSEEIGEEVDEELLLALAFLNERQRERARKDSKLKPTVDCGIVRGALAALHDGYAWNCDNDIASLWTLDDSAIPPVIFEGGSPLPRLAVLYKRTLASAHSGEYKRRILALLIHHECRKSGIPMSNEGSEELEKLAELSFQSTNDLRLTAQSWLRVINSWGMGGLMMPGPGQRGVFERELSKEQVKDLWAFCEKHMPNIALQVGNMHKTVKDLLTKSMRIFGMDVAALETIQTPLAEAYRTHWQQGTAQQPSNTAQTTRSQLTTCHGSTGLDTLATAAFQQELCDDQGLHESGVDSEHVLPPSGTGDGAFANPEGAVLTSTTGLTGMTQQFGMRPSSGTQWHPETNSWRPDGISPLGSAFNDASTFPLGYNESDMSAGNSSASLMGNNGQFLNDEWRNFLMEGF